MKGERIKDFLKKRQQELFTGCIKMVFEDGKLSLVTEANRLEIPQSRIFSQNTVSELLDMAAGRDFCGTIVFFYSRGKPEFYSFSRNYRGSSLEAILNNAKEEDKE